MPANNYKNVTKRLLAGVREAHTELFALMLAERAAKVRGRYNSRRTSFAATARRQCAPSLPCPPTSPEKAGESGS